MSITGLMCLRMFPQDNEMGLSEEISRTRTKL